MKLGEYEHSKSGRKYRVTGTARHSETLDEYVVYEAQYTSEEFGANALWIRPKSMFIENIELNGKPTPRFRYIGI